MTYDLTIQDKLRASSIKRWHMVSTSKVQTVAEHSFNVALIAMELCKRLGNTRRSLLDQVARLAIEHDLDEVMLGDAPSSAKPKKEWKSLSDLRTIIKIADVIDAYVFIHQYRVDRHGDKVAEWMVTCYEEMLAYYHPTDAAIMKSVCDDLLNGEYVVEP